MGSEYIYELETISAQLTLANKLKIVELGFEFAHTADDVKALREQYNRLCSEALPKEDALA